MKNLGKIVVALSAAYGLLPSCKSTPEPVILPPVAPPAIIRSDAQESEESAKDQKLRLFGLMEKDELYNEKINGKYTAFEVKIMNAGDLTGLTQVIDNEFKEILSLHKTGLINNSKLTTLKEKISLVFEKSIKNTFDSDSQAEGLQQESGSVKKTVLDYADLANSALPCSVMVREYEVNGKKTWLVTDTNRGDNKTYVVAFSEDGKKAETLQTLSDHQVPQGAKLVDIIDKRNQDYKTQITHLKNYGCLPGETQANPENAKKLIQDYLATAEGKSLHASIAYLGHRPLSNGDKKRVNGGLHSKFGNNPEFNVAEAYGKGAIDYLLAAEMIAEAQTGRYLLSSKRLTEVVKRTTELGQVAFETTDGKVKVKEDSAIGKLFANGLICDATRNTEKITTPYGLDDRMSTIFERTEVGNVKFVAMPYFK